MPIMQRIPESEDDWIIHSINIHGAFFELRCEHAIREQPGWEIVATREPVEFPPSNGTTRGKESNLDIEAQFSTDGRTRLVRLLIECKKNNPEFVKWIFFPKQSDLGWGSRGSDYEYITAHAIRFNPSDRSYKPSFQDEMVSVISKAPLTDEAREVRGSYRDHKNEKTKTRTANDAVSDASRQIALATQAKFESAKATFRRLLTSVSPENLPRHQRFLPVIVTSAKLFVCRFNPADVNLEIGEIGFDATTIEEHKYLRYEYPLPKYLQSQSTSTEAPEENTSRMDILVVHSAHLSEFLVAVARSTPSLF